MRTQRSADIASGCFLSFLGLVVLYASTKITGGMEERLPPRTLPYILGFTVLAGGVLLALRAWSFRGENPAIKWPDRAGMRRIIVTLLSLMIFIALLSPLGMPIGTALFITFLIRYLNRSRILYAATIGLLSGAVVLFLFAYLLELSIPLGPFTR